MEVERSQLKPSLKKCDQRKPDDIWPGLVPLIKTSSHGTSMMVTLQGKNIDLAKVPAAAVYAASVEKAKPGEWVGYVFTAEDGTKSAVILDSPVQ